MKKLSLSLPYILISIFLFIYIFVKSNSTSFTHDESISFLLLKGKKDWALTANTHWLNSGLAFITSRFFGYNEWALRLPNVLSFIIYSFFCYKITVENSKYIFSSILSACFLLLNPFLLDFFSLFRGYGLAMAFFIICVFYFFKLYEKYEKNNLRYAIVFSILTIYANYSFFYEVCILHLCFIIYNYSAFKVYYVEIIKLFILECLCLLPAVANMMILIKNGQLYYGGNEGYIEDTLRSVISAIFQIEIHHYQNEIIKWGLLGLFIIGFILGRKHKYIGHISNVIFLSILLPTLMNLFFNVKYPIGRTGLYWVIFIGILLHAFMDIYIRSSKKLIYSPFFIFALFFVTLSVYSFAKTITLKQSVNWPYDDTKLMLDDLNEIRDTQYICHLGVSWPFEPTVNYYRNIKNYKWLSPVTRERVKDKYYDYYYVFDIEKKDIVYKCQTIKYYPATKTFLLKNIEKNN